MIRIGVICPSDIAFRRFLPALQKADGICFSGISIANPDEWFGGTNNVTDGMIRNQQEHELAKAQSFVDQYGGKIYIGYQSIIDSEEIDALYIPLPPALHYKWAKMALERGKHVFVEKPSTTSLKDTDELIRIGSDRGLALHENYMFIFHNQINALRDVVESGEIGDIRLYRITFGFPLRPKNDFRYNKSLGGGALLDAGGYCLKYGDLLLGHSAILVTAKANFVEGFDVEMYGSATMCNDNGDVVQIAFGMDNDYHCDIEIWGSKGTLTSTRILTAPTGFIPTYTIKKNQEFETRSLPADDSFLKSINRFVSCIKDDLVRKENYEIMHRQEFLVEQFIIMSSLKNGIK